MANYTCGTHEQIQRLSHLGADRQGGGAGSVRERTLFPLNVGEPDFGTPDYIKVAGMKAIADNFTKYTPATGSWSCARRS